MKKSMYRELHSEEEKEDKKDNEVIIVEEIYAVEPETKKKGKRNGRKFDI